ncbi:acid-sensing ion channel 3-like [Oculina patagonica]
METELKGIREKRDKCVQEAKEALRSERDEASRVMKDFGSYTTLHGFHFVFDSGSMIRRIIWVTLILLGICFLFFQFRDNYRKLRSNRSVIGKDLEHSQEMLFPAITICNQNMMRKSKIMGTDAQTFLDQQDDVKAKVSGKTSLEKEISPNFNVEESVRKNSHNLSEMMKECSWQKEPCTTANFTSVLSFMRGVCHTFNSGQPGHPKIYVTTAGKMQALSLYLDAQPEEYYGPYSYDATGFKILVHDQSELYPNVEDFALDVTPGFTTNIRVRKNKLISLESPFKSNCSSRNLTSFKVYSEYACLTECYTNITVRKCGCRLISMPNVGVNKTRYCSAKEIFECVFPIFGNFNPSNCDCPVPCTKITYHVQASMAYAPSNHLWDTIFPLFNLTLNDTGKVDEFQKFIRQRMVQVHIYYETLDTEVTEEKPAYDLNDFGSDVGGNMGLFLGCSLLTLCEFVDLIVIMCLRCWRKKNAVDLKGDRFQ